MGVGTESGGGLGLKKSRPETKLIPGKRHPETGRIERMAKISAEPDGLLPEGPPPIEPEPASGALPKPKEPTDEEIKDYYRKRGNYTAADDAPKDD